MASQWSTSETSGTGRVLPVVATYADADGMLRNWLHGQGLEAASYDLEDIFSRTMNYVSPDDMDSVYAYLEICGQLGLDPDPSGQSGYYISVKRPEFLRIAQAHKLESNPTPVKPAPSLLAPPNAPACPKCQSENCVRLHVLYEKGMTHLEPPKPATKRALNILLALVALSILPLILFLIASDGYAGGWIILVLVLTIAILAAGKSRQVSERNADIPRLRDQWFKTWSCRDCKHTFEKKTT